jgi:hypothetical protein
MYEHLTLYVNGVVSKLAIHVIRVSRFNHNPIGFESTIESACHRVISESSHYEADGCKNDKEDNTQDYTCIYRPKNMSQKHPSSIGPVEYPGEDKGRWNEEYG